MVNKLFEHIGTKIVLSNPWLDTFSVNCIEIPFKNGDKRIVNLEGDEKEDLSINDISGNGFYIKINPRFNYTEQRQLTSSGREFLVEIRFKFVFFSINAELEYSKLALENKFANSFRILNFNDYAGNERSIRLNISQTNIDGLQIFKEEVGKDYDFGSEGVFIALDGVLSFLSTDNYCDSECGLAVSESTLKTLDFCDPAIIALLNEKQRACLESEFGGSFDCSKLAGCQTIIDIQQGLADEILARQNSGIYLENYIDQEVTDRVNADNALSTSISNHTSDITNPHDVTLEQARSQNSSISGDINANTNTIINLKDAVNPQEPITKNQFDSYISSVGQQRGSVDCSTNPNYPASNVGDRWEVTVAGKIGGALGVDVQVYDEIVCKTQSVAGDQAAVGANFYLVQGNLERASETVSGYTQYASDAEVQAGTENTKSFTALKLANWWTYIKTQAQTFAAKITFTTAPRFSSTTANQRLEVDANKDLISVAKGTADNKNFGTTAGTVAEGSSLGLKADLTDIRFKSDEQLISEALGSVIIASTIHSNRVTNFYTLVDTRMDMQAVYIREPKTITGVKWFQSTQGNYTADNYNGIGLYSYDGAGTLTLVASSTDDGNIWKGASFTIQSKAFSSTYNASAGIYFIALLYNNSAQVTAPAIGAGAGLLNNNIPAVDYTNSAKYRGNRVTLSSLPSTQSMTGGSGLALINSMLYLALY